MNDIVDAFGKALPESDLVKVSSEAKKSSEKLFLVKQNLFKKVLSKIDEELEDLPKHRVKGVDDLCYHDFKTQHNKNKFFNKMNSIRIKTLQELKKDILDKNSSEEVLEITPDFEFKMIKKFLKKYSNLNRQEVSFIIQEVFKELKKLEVGK